VYLRSRDAAGDKKSEHVDGRLGRKESLKVEECRVGALTRAVFPVLHGLVQNPVKVSKTCLYRLLGWSGAAPLVTRLVEGMLVS
jgi:hypothetical protein